jgi:hypothetical protein
MDYKVLLEQNALLLFLRGGDCWMDYTKVKREGNTYKSKDFLTKNLSASKTISLDK